MIKKWVLVFKSFMLLLIMVLQDVTIVLAQPTTPAPTTVTVKEAAAAMLTTTTTQMPALKASTAFDKTQPLYEYQLAVWPTDVEDIIEAVIPQNDEIPIHTLIEQPVAVMPDMDYGDAQPGNEANDDDDHDIAYDPSNDLWPTIISEDEFVKPESEPVIVLENYHNKYGNGSEEYKLVLSNGMVNYQRIDYVLVKGRWKPIQQGYYTIPSQQGNRAIYQTTYYRADKSGYHVYKTIQSSRNPAYDYYLQYKKDENNKNEINNKSVDK